MVAFFIIAFTASIPNFFVGISSILHKIPELSFGDIVGGNLVDLTIAVALAALFAKGLPANSRMVQISSLITIFIALLPLLLILDGTLGRGDGIILILIFVLYILWLFSKQERFTKVYDHDPTPVAKKFRVFIRDLGKLALGIILLLVAAEGIVRSSLFFAESFNISLALVGILIVGLGNSIPETYFAIISAKKGENWMILGDLMGAVVVAATMVLGIVALISPIKIPDFSPFAIARIFLIVSALFFLVFVCTERKISQKEAILLLGIYITFIAVEILTK